MLVTVAAYTDAIEAHIAKGRIEADGIPAYIAHEHHIWANWFISNALGGVKVQVLPQFEVDAKSILKAIKTSTYEQLLEDQEGLFEKEVCPECKSEAIVEVRWSQKLALLAAGLFLVPIPYFRGSEKYLVCGNSWVDQHWKNYSLVVLAIIILSTILFCFSVAGTFFYWCRLNGASSQCM